ncbi:MAG: hypothetical protein JWQ40_4223 [Segetibacter sp.]|nr:hypothetical protein [Segetibacter sp.]
MLYDWYKSIGFAEPSFLSLLLILPILIFCDVGNNTKSQGTMLVTTTHFINNVRSFKTS